MPLTFAVLGDSIAYGQGASRPADTIGSRLTAELIASGRTTRLRVFAVPRARSEALASQVRDAVAWHVQVALIIIGANDLTHFVPASQSAQLLGTAVRTLRAAGSEVIVTPAPDLSVIPWVPLELRALVQNASAMLRSAQTKAALDAGARIADVDRRTSDRFGSDTTLFSPDRFHPSSAGYGLISAALTPTVLAAAAAIGRDRADDAG